MMKYPIFTEVLAKPMISSVISKLNIQGGLFDWSALKMTEYDEKLKYMNWSANCSSRKVLSVNPQ